MPPRTRTSVAWLREHENDIYVQRARQEGWRSRAVFKLMEIDDKDHLLKPGEIVVDLGAAPGGWSQLAAKRVKLPQARADAATAQVFALDLLEMPPIPEVCFIQGDFHDAAVLDKLSAALGKRKIGLVLSDMMPNMSGIPMVDQARGMALAELALEFAQQHLKADGAFLVKVFQGSDFQPFLAAMRQAFVSVSTRKPKASRDRSAEIYLLGRTLKG